MSFVALIEFEAVNLELEFRCQRLFKELGIDPIAYLKRSVLEGHIGNEELDVR